MPKLTIPSKCVSLERSLNRVAALSWLSKGRQIMLRLHAKWLTSVTVTLLGFGLGDARGMAQARYPFETVQEYETSFIPITGNISQVTNIGVSVDKPYGLTNLENTNYGEFDPDTGVIIFNSDPAKFGLEGLPVGSVTFFGQGEDNLFGTISGTAMLDFQNLVGTASGAIAITGGSGRFSGATGILTFFENSTLSPDPIAPLRTQAEVSGSFDVLAVEPVPEPKAPIALVSMGLIGIGMLLRKHRKRGTRG